MEVFLITCRWMTWRISWRGRKKNYGSVMIHYMLCLYRNKRYTQCLSNGIRLWHVRFNCIDLIWIFCSLDRFLCCVLTIFFLLDIFFPLSEKMRCTQLLVCWWSCLVRFTLELELWQMFHLFITKSTNLFMRTE